MNFEYLQSFVAIVDLGSFRKAAESLNKAQPAVSYDIKSLESDLNLTLFDRSSYKPTLTTSGEVFYQKAKNILNQTKELKAHAEFLSQGGDSEVRLSITVLFPLQGISKKLKDFQGQNPYTNLKINMDVLSTMHRLQNEEAHIGITELVNWPYDNFHVVELCKVKMIPVIAAQHPLVLNQKKITFDSHQIKNIPQIVIQSSLPETQKISAGVLTDNLKWRVSDFKSKETMILESLGWGFMPDHMINDKLKSKQLMVLDLKNNPSFEYPLYALKPKRPKSWGPALEKLWKSLIG